MYIVIKIFRLIGCFSRYRSISLLIFYIKNGLLVNYALPTGQSTDKFAQKLLTTRKVKSPFALKSVVLEETFIARPFLKRRFVEILIIFCFDHSKISEFALSRQLIIVPFTTI